MASTRVPSRDSNSGPPYSSPTRYQLSHAAPYTLTGLAESGSSKTPASVSFYACSRFLHSSAVFVFSEPWLNSGTGLWQTFPGTPWTTARSYLTFSSRWCCQRETATTGTKISCATYRTYFAYMFTQKNSIYVLIFFHYYPYSLLHILIIFLKLYFRGHFV